MLPAWWRGRLVRNAPTDFAWDCPLARHFVPRASASCRRLDGLRFVGRSRNARRRRLAGPRESGHRGGVIHATMALLANRTLILDGGLATELEARGYDISGRLWSARVLRSTPDAIEQLHYDYYAAGADCAITASYQASYEGFAAVGLDAGETTRLLRLSVELAMNARTRYRGDHPDDRRELFVAASVGPYGATTHDGAEYVGDYGLSVDELVAFHARRFEVLANTGADFLA